MKVCLFDACFLIIHKGINCVSLTPCGNLVSTNKCCLFKQFKDDYDSDTAVWHGIISKSDEDNV